MGSYVDCSGCGWLIRSEETRCPFCGVGGTVGAPPLARWAFGISLTVGLGMVGCGPKSDDGMETAADSQDDDADGVTYAGPDEDSSFTAGEPTTSITTYPNDADAVTYAGPDETWSTTFESSSTSETTVDPTDADAVTYAGPDEDSSTTEPAESSTGESSETTGESSETTGG